MRRREFVAGVGTGLVLSAAGRGALGQAIPKEQEMPLILDANGEIRLTHPMSLIREVIASGTRSESVTVTDPKTFGESALDQAISDIMAYDRHIAEHHDLLIKATCVADIHLAKAENKLAIFYQLQNTTPVQKDLERVNMLYNLGLRSLQLTYNYQNYVGAGCRERTDAGLTVFGIELIERMNEIGMLVDTSHANMPTMREAIEVSIVPTTVSHTACQAVHEHVRNTTDENLRLLADSGGVVGLCQIRPFITAVNSADNVKFYFDHIAHAVNVAGVEHVCIGSDRDHRVIEDSEEELAILLEEEGAQFQPADWPLYMPALNGPRRMEVVWDGVKGLGYSEDDVEKIMGLNLLRLYSEVIG